MRQCGRKPVVRSNVLEQVTATGPVAPAQTLPVSFKTSGKLVDLKVQVGQKVSLQALEFGYLVAILADGQPGPTVAEVAGDYIVLDDEAAGVRTRIPMHYLQLAPTPPITQPSAA